MGERSRLEIYLEIMQGIQKKECIASLGKIVNLPPSNLKRHLIFLESQGFIKTARLRDKKLIYELTEKGLEVLSAFEKLTHHTFPVQIVNASANS